MDKGNLNVNLNDNPNVSINGNSTSTADAEEFINKTDEYKNNLNDNIYKRKKSITPEYRIEKEKQKFQNNKNISFMGSNPINGDNETPSNNPRYIIDSDIRMNNEVYNRMIMELEQNFNKELCKNQLEIIYIYSNKGKFVCEMLPGILNSVYPTIRFEVFKLSLENLYEWPSDETYFNSIICFLPTNKHSEAKEIIKDKNRAACCCTIF
jgi:hypothetical protein